jgi:hypothetical protein
MIYLSKNLSVLTDSDQIILDKITSYINIPKYSIKYSTYGFDKNISKDSKIEIIDTTRIAIKEALNNLNLSDYVSIKKIDLLENKIEVILQLPNGEANVNL